MPRRYYTSTAVATTLAGSISNSATSITVTALSGFPVTTPWTAIIDKDTASVEVVQVTNVTGTTLTVSRGVDGTTPVAHNAGATFSHGVSGRDFDEANAHINDNTTDVHAQYVLKSVVNAKGDLLVGSANDTVSILGVGSNDQLLVADSAAADGVKWAGLSASQIPTLTASHIPALSSVKISTVDINTQSGSYTLVLSDASKLILMGSASAQTLTVPTNASVAFPVGTKVDVIQTGAGQCDIAGAAGVTVNSEGSKKKLFAQYQAVSLVKTGTDSWLLIGALKA